MTESDRDATNAPESPTVNGAAPRVGLIAAVACAGIFVGYLPIMAGPVGLSAVARATSASASDLEWIVSMLVLPMAALILTFGAWGERWGRRRVLIVGLILAIVGGLVSIFAGAVAANHAIYFIWAGQFLAGAGAAALIPATLAIISAAQPDPHRRVMLIAAWSGSMMAAMAAGAYISAAILKALEWNWLFLPAVIAAVLVLVIGVPLIPESRSAVVGRIDGAGQVLTALGVAALVYGVIVGGSDGYSHPKSYLALIAAALLIGAFIWVEMNADNPLLDLRVFRFPNFSMAALVATAAMFAYLGVNFGLALYFSTLQLTPFEVANRYIFLIGGSVVGSNLAGMAMRRQNAQSVLAVVCIWTGLAMVGASFLDGTAPNWQTDLRLIFLGVGIGGVLATVTASAVNAVPHRQAGMASAAVNAVRQTGGALGPAVYSILAASWAVDAIGDKLADHGVVGRDAQVISGLVEADGVQHGGAVAAMMFPHQPVGAALGEAQAYGFGNTALVSAAVFIVLGVGCAILRVIGARRGPVESETVSLRADVVD